MLPTIFAAFVFHSLAEQSGLTHRFAAYIYGPDYFPAQALFVEDPTLDCVLEIPGCYCVPEGECQPVANICNAELYTEPDCFTLDTDNGRFLLVAVEITNCCCEAVPDSYAPGGDAHYHDFVLIPGGIENSTMLVQLMPIPGAAFSNDATVRQFYGEFAAATFDAK